MVGMAAGSWRALRRRETPRAGAMQAGDVKTVAWLQALVGVASLLLYALFACFAGVKNPLGLWLVSQIAFPVLALVCGIVGGYQFPVASRVFFGFEEKHRNAGTLYALDLAGASLGAVGLSAWWVPVFGFLRTAELIAVVNLAPAVLAVLATVRWRKHQE